jgi:hypothetical protein
MTGCPQAQKQEGVVTLPFVEAERMSNPHGLTQGREVEGHSEEASRRPLGSFPSLRVPHSPYSPASEMGRTSCFEKIMSHGSLSKPLQVFSSSGNHEYRIGCETERKEKMLAKRKRE